MSAGLKLYFTGRPYFSCTGVKLLSFSPTLAWVTTVRFSTTTRSSKPSARSLRVTPSICHGVVFAEG